MCLRNVPLLALSAIVTVSLAVGLATEQAAIKPSASGVDGQLRSELSLGGRTVTLASPPALGANDPASRDVLSPSDRSVPARVRVAQLETNGSLRIGELAVGRRDPPALRYDLWLEATNTGWQLQVVDTSAGDSAVVGHISLTRNAAGASPQLIAALVPETENTGRLLLRWGEHEAVTKFVFTDPPQRRRLTESGQPNVPVNRAHDEDTSALSRARLLAQRNETALVLPKGQRLSVSFQRSFPKGEQRSSGDGGARTRGLPVDGPDFARLTSTAVGAVVQLTESAVPRLRIESPLRFGKTTVPIGNQGPGFPGSYGIWLKRVGSGWRLVLNHEADAWGSQHDPKFDAAEIALTHSEGHPASRPFAVALVLTGADRGRLLILWGPHEWTADFVVT